MQIVLLDGQLGLSQIDGHSCNALAGGSTRISGPNWALVVGRHP